MTAAPLRDRTYQAARLSPSFVRSVTSSYSPTELGGLHGRSRAMRREDPHRDRHDEHVRNDDRHESNRSAPQVAEPSGLAGAPEQNDGE